MVPISKKIPVCPVWHCLKHAAAFVVYFAAAPGLGPLLAAHTADNGSILGAVGPWACQAQEKMCACSHVRRMLSQVVYTPCQTTYIHVRLLPDKGKPVVRRGRKAMAQAWGLRAGLPKEGCWTAHIGAVRGLHHRKDILYAFE